MAAKKGRDLKIKATLNAVDNASGPITKAFKEVRAQAAITTKSFEAIGKKMMLATAAGAGALAAAGAVVFKKTVDWASEASEMIKFSRQVGFGVEALQELEFAANRQGVGADNLRKSLEKMNQVVGQAKIGQGALSSYLQRTDRRLLRQVRAAKTNEEAFDLLLGKLDSIDGPAKKAAFATAAFGRSGMRMVRMLQGGPEELQRLREEMRRYGVISQSAAEDAEVLDDEMENFRRTIKGTWNVIASRLVPVFTPLVERTKEWILAHRDFVTGKIQQGIDRLIEGLAAADRWWGENKESIKEMANVGFGALKKALEILKSAMAVIEKHGDEIKTLVSVLATVYIGSKLVSAVQSLELAFAAVAKSPHFLAIAATIAAAHAMKKEFERETEQFVKDQSLARTGVRATRSEDEARASGKAAALAASRQARAGRAFAAASRQARAGRAFAGESTADDDPRWQRLREKFPETKTEVTGEIKVSFENAPPGMQVQKVEKPKGQGVDLSAAVGYNLAGGVAL